MKYWYFCLFVVLGCRIYHPSATSISSFVIVFQGSQGSSYLIEMLSQLRDVCILGYEPLGEASMGASSTKLHRLLYPGNSSLHVHLSKVGSLLDSHEHTSKCNGRETTYGLKARLNPATVSQLVKMPSFSQTKFLILRRNMLKQAVGTYRRKYCGLGQFELRIKVEQKRSQEEIRQFKNKKCDVQVRSLQRLCLLYWRHHEGLAGLAQTHRDKIIEITYEDIMKNVTQVVDKQIAPFLGVSASRKRRGPPTLQKASPDLLCRSVGNFDAMCSMVRRDLPPAFTEWINANQCGPDSSSETEGECCPLC